MTEALPEVLVSLAEAADSYDFDGIAFLVMRGASADSTLDDGTLLTWAVRQGQQGLVRQLIDAQANPDLCDIAGETPLIHAARNGMQEICEILVEAGADPFARNRAGKTAYEAALAAKAELSNEIDDPNADLSSVESLFGRYGRIALLLEEAEERRTQENEIASCHTGAPNDVTILPPIKFAKPEGMP